MKHCSLLIGLFYCCFSLVYPNSLSKQDFQYLLYLIEDAERASSLRRRFLDRNIMVIPEDSLPEVADQVKRLVDIYLSVADRLPDAILGLNLFSRFPRNVIPFSFCHIPSHFDALVFIREAKNSLDYFAHYYLVRALHAADRLG